MELEKLRIQFESEKRSLKDEIGSIKRNLSRAEEQAQDERQKLSEAR